MNIVVCQVSESHKTMRKIARIVNNPMEAESLEHILLFSNVRGVVSDNNFTYITVSLMFSNHSQSKLLYRPKSLYITTCVGGPNMYVKQLYSK